MKYVPTQELLNRDLLTYQEILNIKKRMSGYTKSKDVSFSDAQFKEEYKITQEHSDKGLEYLFRVAFKPSKLAEQQAKYNTDGLLDDAIRSNSPLGYRELNILLQFDHFTFAGYYNASNYTQVQMGFTILYPIWKCYDKDGDSFEYYIEGGEMQIIG